MVKIELTKEQALEIKQWRVVENCSWHEISIRFTKKYEKDQRPDSYFGMCITDDAMRMLNEKLEDGWDY